MGKKKDAATIQSKKNHFTCFSCMSCDLDMRKYVMHEHEALKITICEPCYKQHIDEKSKDKKWHGASEWDEVDDQGKQLYCEICGEGGELLACDEQECCASYCVKCLGDWLGEKGLNDIMEDDQIPFVCFRSIDRDDIQEIFPNYYRFRQLSKKYLKEQAALELIEENGYVSDEDATLAIKKAVKNNTGTAKKSGNRIKKFTCFSCFEKCDMSREHLPFIHSKFNVALCSSCHAYLNGDPSEWTLTDGKNDYCVLSGEGGDIVSCDKCENSFTTDVLKKWLDKKGYNKLMEDEDAPFECFTCNPKLGNYQEFLKKTQEFMNVFSDNYSPGKSSKNKNDGKDREEVKRKEKSARTTEKYVKYFEESDSTDLDEPVQIDSIKTVNAKVTDAPKTFDQLKHLDKKLTNGDDKKLTDELKAATKKKEPTTKTTFDNNSTKLPKQNSPKKSPTKASMPPSKRATLDYWEKYINEASDEYKSTDTFKRLKAILQDD